MTSTLYGLPLRSFGFDSAELQDRLIKYKHPEAELVFKQNLVLSETKEDYVSCRIEGIPAQCGIVLYCKWDWLKFDMLKQHLENCHAIARRLLYTKAMITHNDEVFINKLVDEHGWDMILQFMNQRSGNNVFVVTYDL